MKTARLVIHMLLALSAGSVVAQTSKQNVAVYVTGDVEDNYRKVIGSKMVSGITQSNNYAAVERTADFLAALSQEHDFQMSGAVSDNQIVKLGKQFGVRYVLVADISEIFDAMFIAARMIDVQTGQIAAATEADATVNSAKEMLQLSDKVISQLMTGATVNSYKATNNIEDIKVLGPFTTAGQLWNHVNQIPEGYHRATSAELEALIKAYKEAGKYIHYPIYDVTGQDSTITNYNFLMEDGSSYQSYEQTFGYDKILETYTDRANWNCSITPGYIYLIKNN